MKSKPADAFLDLTREGGKKKIRALACSSAGTNGEPAAQPHLYLRMSETDLAAHSQRGGKGRPEPIGPLVGPGPGKAPVPVGPALPVTKGGSGASPVRVGLPDPGCHGPQGLFGPLIRGPSNRFWFEKLRKGVSPSGNGNAGPPLVGKAVPEGTMPVGKAPVGITGPPVGPVGAVGIGMMFGIVPDGPLGWWGGP